MTEENNPKNYTKIQKIILLVGGVIIVILLAAYFQTDLLEDFNSGEVIKLTWQGREQEKSFREKQVTKQTENWKTYENQEYSFSIKYPDNFLIQTPDSSPLYKDDNFSRHDGENAVLVVASDNYAPGTNLSSAYINIVVNENIKLSGDCRIFVKGDGLYQAENRKDIFDNIFYIGSNDGAAAGTKLDEKIYRIFKNDICYELSTRLFTTNIGNYEPGTVKEVVTEEVLAILELVVLTFNGR